MKLFLVMCAFFGMGYSGVIEHHHEHHDGAKSYQHVNIDNYHAVPVYIKHADKELLKHRIGGVQHNVKVSHGHGKHDSGHAIITSAVEGHGHEGHGNHESTLIGKHVLSESGHNFGGSHEGLSLAHGHEAQHGPIGGHDAHHIQLEGHESLGSGHEEASHGAGGHEGLSLEGGHGGLSLGGVHGGFGGGHEGYTFKGHEALSGSHENYGGHENGGGASEHEHAASYGVHETSGGDDGGHQQGGYDLSHLGHH